MPTIDDTLRSGDDSSRISSGRDQASAARSRPLPPGLPAQHTPPKKAAAEADYAGFFGLSASARCRRARRNFATIAGGASKPTARRPLSIGIRAPIGLSQIGRQGCRKASTGPAPATPQKAENPRPTERVAAGFRVHRMASVSKETPAKNGRHRIRTCDLFPGGNRGRGSRTSKIRRSPRRSGSTDRGLGLAHR